MAQSTQELQWSDVFGDTFRAQGIGEIRWMNEGSTYSSLLYEDGVAVIYENDLSDQSKKIIFKADLVEWPESGKNYTIDDYSFSANERYILLATEQERIWRRSRKAQYFIYDRQQDLLIRLYHGSQKQSLAEFSPDYSSIAFVAGRNLFIHDLGSGEVQQITDDGEEGSIINGATDWVYEEEFYLTKAWVWTADSKSLIYLKFDESNVPLFTMEEWGSLYSDFTTFKYPKAGEENAKVSVWVFEKGKDQHSRLDLGVINDWYIPRIYSGKNASDFYLILTNRLQNELRVIRSDASNKKVDVVLQEQSPYWLDMTSAFEITDDGNGFLWMSDIDGWNHLYLKYFDREEWVQLTKGPWEVDRLLGFDQKTAKVYFTAAKESPIERELYTVDINTEKLTKITPEKGWHQISFSKDYKFFIDTYSSEESVPEYRLHTSDGVLVRVLEDNEELNRTIEGFKLPKKSFEMIPNEEGDSLLSYVIYPPNFSKNKRYPLLMFVYGGPRSQQVQNRFSMSSRDLFHQYLATQGVVVACVDGRGTAARGRDFKKQVYKRLGDLETKDQVASASYFGNLPYIDANQIGIWGWSYGGYMSSLSLAYAPDVFKAAAAVAPVTHWKFYDTIYTERFMQTPQLNEDGYEAFAPVNLAKHIKPHSYLLLHGMGDDNVHFQNAVAMSEALIKENIPFQSVFYPNRNHGMVGKNGNAQPHVYLTLRDFFLQKFNLAD